MLAYHYYVLKLESLTVVNLKLFAMHGRGNSPLNTHTSDGTPSKPLINFLPLGTTCLVDIMSWGKGHTMSILLGEKV